MGELVEVATAAEAIDIVPGTVSRATRRGRTVEPARGSSPRATR